MFEKTSLESKTGATLNLRSMTPSDAPKAVVHINHGMAEHAARYERFASELAAAGYAVYVHDARGHGETTAPDAPLGSFGKVGLDAVLADISAVQDHIRTLHADVPIICFGHSMGAIMLANHAMRFGNIAGLAIWNTTFETGVLLPVSMALLKLERLIRGGDKKSVFATKLSFETWNAKFKPNRTTNDWISRDEAEVDKYLADPLCGFEVDINLWISTLEAVFYVASTENLNRLDKKLPIHVLSGSDDESNDHGQGMVNFAKRLAGWDDVTSILIDNNRHEALNEITRDETTAGFIKWLDERF